MIKKAKSGGLAWAAEQRVTRYLPMLVAVTGDLVSGIMLSRIVYWFTPNEDGQSKLRVIKSGRLWLVRGRKDWLLECGFTRNQYHGAITKLRRMKLVDTKVGLFKHQHSLFIRLRLDQLTKLVTEKRVVLKSDGPSVKTRQRYLESRHLISNKDTTGKRQGDVRVTTAKEELRKFEAQKAGTVARAVEAGRKNVDGLCSEWMKLVPYYHNVGHMLLPLTHTQRGMISHFRTRVGREHAHEVMEWAVREWKGRFAKQVMLAQNHSLHYEPNPAYLLKYAQEALNGWHNSLSAQGPKAVQSTAQAPVVTKYKVK